MWVEILIRCCTLLVLYKLLCGEVDVNCPHSNACFAVASRLEKLYGGKCFVGLRIPVPDSVTRQHIDLVLVTEKEMIVVAVRNSSGYIEVGTDGNWTCTNQNICATKTFADPVMEISSQMMILQSYLEQRGASLPKGHITGRVIFPNPNCMVSRSIEDPYKEVFTSEKWRDLKSDSGIRTSSWISFKDIFSSKKGENKNQEALHKNIHFILSTSPMWDRLELRGHKNILGEFIEFKGHQCDMSALQQFRRSEVSRITIQQTFSFNGGKPRIEISYWPRDFRSAASSSYSSFEMTDIAVELTKIRFRPFNSNKARNFKLSSLVSLTLSS